MAALTWVQSHIGAFGGDPQRVTLAADRSGADVASIHLLISRPTRLQLFRKALLMVSCTACFQYYSTISLTLETGWLWLLLVFCHSSCYHCSCSNYHSRHEWCRRLKGFLTAFLSGGRFYMPGYLYPLDSYWG